MATQLIPTWKMNAHKQGDTWDGQTMRIQQDMTGCLIEAEFTMPQQSTPTKRFSTADGTIVVMSTGAQSVFILQPFRCQMPVGRHVGELFITYPGNRKKTRLNIEWEITT